MTFHTTGSYFVSRYGFSVDTAVITFSGDNPCSVAGKITNYHINLDRSTTETRRYCYKVGNFVEISYEKLGNKRHYVWIVSGSQAFPRGSRVL